MNDDMYKSEAAEEVDTPEVCPITYKNKRVIASLIARVTYDIGTLETWNSESGIFICLIPPNHNLGNAQESRKMIRMDGALYETPINLGNGVFYFTEYWEGTIPDNYIGVPLKFSPAKASEYFAPCGKNSNRPINQLASKIEHS